MNNITLLIATRNRFEKLKRTLASVPKLDYLRTLVVCDGDIETFENLDGFSVMRLLIQQHIGSVKARNYALYSVPMDGVLYATDDVVFEKHSIQHAFHLFNRKFPDNDGVIGFTQNQSFHPTGVALVGNTFLNRYPKRSLFYPKYYHFACQEILSFCETFKEPKFYSDKKAKIQHFHPGFCKGEEDTTHEEARKFKDQDLNISKERKEKGLFWPIT